MLLMQLRISDVKLKSQTNDVLDLWNCFRKLIFIKYVDLFEFCTCQKATQNSQSADTPENLSVILLHY